VEAEKTEIKTEAVETPAAVAPKPRKINWVIRLGLWLEGQRPARLFEQRVFQATVQDRLAAQDKRIAAADFVKLIARLQQCEKILGLYRDPFPQAAGTASTPRVR
jgi:hypothetical protein